MTGAAAGVPATGGVRIYRAAKVQAFVLIGLLGSTTGSAQTWRVTPSINVSETLTDNVSLASSDRKQSDLITQITPGIRIDGRSGRAQLNLDYRVSEILYVNQAASNNRQNNLSALGTLEAIDQWLFLEASANISQQAVSAFGPQPTTDGEINSNRAEARTYRLSPYVRGQLGGAADYQLRYDWTTTTAKGTQFAPTQVEQWLGIVNGRTVGPLSWSVNASQQVVHREPVRDSEERRFGGSLIYQLSPEIRMTALGGWERNNYAGVDSESSPTYGARVNWAPSPRTQMSAFKEKRQFGNSHELTFTHRTPLTSWQLSDRKDITSLPNQLIIAPLGTAYDLLFNQLSSSIPDPILRGRAVESLLQQNGIPRDLGIAAGFLTTRVFVQRAQQASVAFNGLRNVLTLAAARTESEAVTGGASSADAFSQASQIRQRSFSASWAHELSALSSLNLFANQVRSNGSGGPAELDSKQSSLSLLLSHRIGVNTYGTLGARAVRFDSSTGPGYREKALVASVNMTF